MYKISIFDLDGTLLDSLPDIHDALYKLLQNHGGSPHSFEFTKEIIGDGVHELVKKAFLAQNIRFDDTMVEEYRKIYYRNAVSKSVLYDGVIKMLDEVKKHTHHIVMLTNKDEEISRTLSKHYNIYKYFDDIIGGDTMAERKPSPLPIKNILKRYGMTQTEAIMIGDSKFDILAGSAAGIDTCFCSYGYGKSDELLATYTVDQPIDIIKIWSK